MEGRKGRVQMWVIKANLDLTTDKILRGRERGGSGSGTNDVSDLGR